MILECQRRMERKITHVTLRDRVRCEDLRRSTGMRDASNLAERQMEMERPRREDGQQQMDTQAFQMGH